MIEDKAIELGRMIGQSPEYQAVKRANEALSGDRDAVALLQRLEQLRVDAQRMIERGENPTPEMEQQLDQLLGTIQSKPIYQAAVTSQENFDKIMARVNNSYVGEATDIDFTYGTLPHYDLVGLRFGLIGEKLEGYLFADNLTDKRAQLGINTTGFSYTIASLIRVATNQPRTIGVDLKYRF